MIYNATNSMFSLRFQFHLMSLNLNYILAICNLILNYNLTVKEQGDLSCLPHWFRRTEDEEVECFESKSEDETCFDHVASFVQNEFLPFPFPPLLITDEYWNSQKF